MYIFILYLLAFLHFFLYSIFFNFPTPFGIYSVGVLDLKVIAIIFFNQSTVFHLSKKKKSENMMYNRAFVINCYTWVLGN